MQRTRNTMIQTSKAWKTGNKSLVLTLKREAIETLGIGRGDWIQAELNIVKKADQTSEKPKKSITPKQQIDQLIPTPEPLPPKNSVADSVKERIKRLKQKRG